MCGHVLLPQTLIGIRKITETCNLKGCRFNERKNVACVGIWRASRAFCCQALLSMQVFLVTWSLGAVIKVTLQGDVWVPVSATICESHQLLGILCIVGTESLSMTKTWQLLAPERDLLFLPSLFPGISHESQVLCLVHDNVLDIVPHVGQNGIWFWLGSTLSCTK